MTRLRRGYVEIAHEMRERPMPVRRIAAGLAVDESTLRYS